MPAAAAVTVALAALAAASPSAVGGADQRLLVLGRVVNLSTLRAERTVTGDAPEREVSDPGADFGAVLLRKGTVEAFRLSTGARLWSKTPDAPCTAILELGASHVYVVCGGKLLAFGRDSGASAVVDAGPVVVQAVVAGALVASRRQDGRVTLYDTASNKRLGTKVLPELTRTMASDSHLVAAAGVTGICAVGLKLGTSVPRGWGYFAGCYDPKLSRLWAKTLTFDRPAAARYYVRQLGPFHLVLDDQAPPWVTAAALTPAAADAPTPAAAAAARNGALVRWRDGQVTELPDHTFATIEDGRGDRLVSPAVRAIWDPAPAPPPGQEAFIYREARTAQDGRGRAFALVKNGGSGLAGVDRASGRVLFVTPVPLGAATWTLDAAGGVPVVRTAYAGKWQASLIDADTGRIAYKDERPVATPEMRH